MLQSDIIKLHVGEELEIPNIGIIVKLLSFKVTYGGKEYEEFGDIHELEYMFKKSSEKKIVKYGWCCRTPDKYRHFEVFGYEILHINDSYEIFEKKDEGKDWMKFVIYKPEKEINYQKLLAFYRKKDSNIR